MRRAKEGGNGTNRRVTEGADPQLRPSLAALPRRARAGASLAAVAFTAACGSKTPPATTCDQECLDNVAVRAVRETMKFAYNWTVQNQPVGPQDAGTDRFLAGTAQVSGSATSDPLMGTTKVNLKYVFVGTNYLRKDDAPSQNYNVVIDGTITQEGILAVQPSSTTALRMSSMDLRVVGTVYDPAVDYDEPKPDAGIDAGGGCALELTQSGSDVAGKFCGRTAGFHF